MRWVNSPLVAGALHWIHQNIHRGIQAADVAKATRVSQQGLQKAFAARHIRSPGQYRKQRLIASQRIQ